MTHKILICHRYDFLVNTDFIDAMKHYGSSINHYDVVILKLFGKDENKILKSPYFLPKARRVPGPSTPSVRREPVSISATIYKLPVEVLLSRIKKSASILNKKLFRQFYNKNFY